MTEEEVSATGVSVIGNFTNPNWQAGALQMTDDDMDGVYEVTVNISGSATILYKFTNGYPTTGDNGVDFVEESGILLDEEGNELANFEADGCGLPNGFGAYNRIHERSGDLRFLMQFVSTSAARVWCPLMKSPLLNSMHTRPIQCDLDIGHRSSGQQYAALHRDSADALYRAERRCRHRARCV